MSFVYFRDEFRKAEKPTPNGDPMQNIVKIQWTPEQIEDFERKLDSRPHFERLNHVSLSVRDLEASKQFYAEVLGGRLILELPTFAEVLVAGIVIGMSSARGQRAQPDAEYPHFAFEIASDQFLPMKRWLESNGVKTHDLWTRGGVEALMYFKDPSGNLIEIYCPQYKNADALPKAFAITDLLDLRTLAYDWRQ